MRLALPIAASPGKTSSSSLMAWAFGLGMVVVVGTAANLTHDRLFHREASAATEPPKADEPRFDPKTTVVMSEGKFASAGIKVEAVQVVEMPREFPVTGRIEADPNRRVEVRPRAPGVVRSVPVLPGSKVKAGDVLVVLDSPDVGSARLKVRERQRELATIRVEAGNKGQIADNAQTMIKRLAEGASAKQIAKQFDKKLVGNSRGTLIAAWADLEMAEHEFEKQDDLNKQKIVGEHPVFLAEHTREGAQARFDAALEQVRIDVIQQDLVARQMVRNAEEMVVDAAQRLRILGVTEDFAELLAHPERASALPSGSEDLTAYPIVSPIDGTVVSTFAVRSQSVDLSTPLFVVADLSKVYAVADVPESDFAALPGLAAGKVRVVAMANPGRYFDARMVYTGSEVNPSTRTVRLVAEAANPDGLLILGMFARILLDTATTEKATTVPISAILTVDGKPAVFVPGKEERSFVIRPVKLGREALGRQVITEGLKPKDRVVVAGAFPIKSELILQNETDEE